MKTLLSRDFYKQFCNRGKQPALSYWRDYGGTHEVDCFLENDAKIYPVEIKSAETLIQNSSKELSTSIHSLMEIQKQAM